MLLLAFAHGLPVVGPASPDPRSLLQDGETAFCFADRSAASVAAAIGRALDDEEARAAVRRSAFARVADGHSLGGTIAAYDVLLKEVVNRRQQAAPS
jgi:glycosyltransferase involved in cell wall biosynthesis